MIQVACDESKPRPRNACNRLHVCRTVAKERLRSRSACPSHPALLQGGCQGLLFLTQKWQMLSLESPGPVTSGLLCEVTIGW